jgi:uncharacterized damage-inducible protein DinB
MNTELAHYLQFFEWLHKELTELLAGLPVEAVNWRPVPVPGDDEVTNSAAALAAHVAGSLRFWVGEVAGGRPAHRNRPAEFKTEAPDGQALRAQLDGALDLVRDVLRGLEPATLDESLTLPNRTVTRRWAIVHAIEHAAIHLGHMQLTLQLWQAQR